MKTKINTFIRDVTRVTSMPKSEVRARLIEILEEAREGVTVDVIKADYPETLMERDIGHNEALAEVEETWNTLMNEIRGISTHE